MNKRLAILALFLVAFAASAARPVPITDYRSLITVPADLTLPTANP